MCLPSFDLYGLLQDYSWPLPLAFGIYATYFVFFAKLLSIRLKSLVAKFGYLDGNVSRDHPPDVRANLVAVRFRLRSQSTHRFNFRS